MSSDKTGHLLLLLFVLFFSRKEHLSKADNFPRAYNEEQLSCPAQPNASNFSSTRPPAKEVPTAYKTFPAPTDKKSVPLVGHSHPHLFQLVWPPSFGRFFTEIHFYREGLERDQRPAFFTYHRALREAFLSPHFLDDQEGWADQRPPPWWIAFWLPANYTTAAARWTTPHRLAPELTAPLIRRLDTEHGKLWVAGAKSRFRNPETGETTDLDYVSFRRLWTMVNAFGVALRDPAEYLRLGSAMMAHLPLARWLALGDIIPTDAGPYDREEVERVLAQHLVPSGPPNAPPAFRLLCSNLNWAELVLTPLDQLSQAFVRLDHPPPSTLHSVVVCVRRDWAEAGGREEEGEIASLPVFVSCPEVIPFHAMDIEPCRQPHLWYYRTLGDEYLWPYELWRNDEEQMEEGEEEEAV